jgi:hypothetical protein
MFFTSPKIVWIFSRKITKSKEQNEEAKTRERRSIDDYRYSSCCGRLKNLPGGKSCISSSDPR